MMHSSTPVRGRFIRGRIIAASSVLALVAAGVALAQDAPSLNFYGVTGLIDMPSGEMQPDGYLNATTAHFGPVSRTTLTFQATPRLSASFRFLGIRDWDNTDDFQGDVFDVYYDRSFDLRYQVTREGKYMPAITVGLQDFVGTGVLSGEYVAATKTLTPDLKVTAGLGWGRLGSYGDIGSPFGEREAVDIGEGGNFNFGQLFRGPMAPFAGVEWQATDRLTLKAEYSSDAYDVEAGTKQAFDRKSPLNFGLEYDVADTLRVGGYYMYGSEFGFSLQFTMNPKQRPMGGIMDGAPDPVKPRPSRGADPDAWSPEWVTQEGAAPVLIGNLNKRLEKDGIIVEAMGYTGSTAQVRIRNTRYDAEAQAIGRVARAMSHVMPASVETFEIVPLVNGMPASKVSVRRSSLERLEFATDADTAMRAGTAIAPPGAPIAGLTYDPELYPRFSWSLGPYNRIRLFDQREPFKMDVGLRLGARYEVAPGWVIAGSATKKVVGNLDDAPIMDPGSTLPPVRSEVELYDANGDPAVESLTLAKYAYLGGDLYGRVTVGYLERMFGGVSAEVLYKPVESPWALGAELNHVKQRDTDGLFGFSEYDYTVTTGHVSAYYAFAPGFHAQLDVGRYLAGDVGATLSIDREFENGWRVGAFATKTDASAEEFGSGSFDKGIRLEIPFAWGTGQPSRKTSTTVLRPFGRDGGARLEVDGRLYDSVRDYHSSGIDEQWGRFWK